MDYERLDRDYREKQISRICQNIENISQRQLTAPGQTIPDVDNVVFGTGKRMQMAVMFVDISGYSGWPAETKAEQERVLVALNLLFSELVRVAEDYGGTLEKNTGDGLMAYFNDNAGDPPEEGSKRAVACSLTMLSIADDVINPFLKRFGYQQIGFRICIDYGYVTIARLGAQRRFGSLVAIGTTANVASKMLGFAEAGEILIGDAVVSRLPLEWQRDWTQFSTARTGWLYRVSGMPYPFYRYIGRWTYGK